MTFLYGTHLFRAPNPPRELRREMLETIAHEHRFNIVRFYPSWDYFSPAPDTYDFEELEELMSDCDALGLRVMAGVVVENAPYWLEHRLPDARYVNARGVPVQLGGASAQPSGGWPGLCFDCETVREEATKFIQALVGMLRQHPSLYVYDVWNEPRLAAAWARDLFANVPDRMFCYCPHSRVAFQRWLAAKYGSVAALNQAWVRRFTSFEEVNPPTFHGTYADWLDWRRFAIDSQTSQMELRVSAVRAADPDHVIESHAAHFPPLDAAALLATDGHALARNCDVWGASLFPHWSGCSPSMGAAKLDVVRSNARGGEFWLTELQGGHGSAGLKRSPTMRDHDIRLWNWLAVAAGAKGIIYWNYYAEATGREATGFGLVDRSRRETEGLVEAARTWQLIKNYEKTISAYRPDPKVAILVSRDAGLLDFAMEGNEERVTGSNLGYHRAVWEADAMADFVLPENVDSRYSLLLVPWHLIGDDESIDAVHRFATAGGTVVLEAGFGLFDKRPYANPQVPPAGLAEKFGYEEDESYYLPEASGSQLYPSWMSGGLRTSVDDLYTNPVMRVGAPLSGELRPQTFLTTVRLFGADPIAHYRDKVVGVRRRVGRGTVYYFGTNVGGAVQAGDAFALRLVKHMIRESAPPPVQGDALRPRLIHGEGTTILAVFNDTGASRSESLRFGEPRWRRAEDLYSSESHRIDDGCLSVTVPQGDVRVFSLWTEGD